jgi:cytochrome oxidase assembly protein ShyY1
VLPLLLALFAAYVAAVTWQMRRAVRTTEPAARLREARRLLGVVALGVPLLGAFILAAW